MDLRVDRSAFEEHDGMAAPCAARPEEARGVHRHWSLPRSTGSVQDDRSAALLAQHTATTDAQRAAVALRLADIRAREAALTPAE